MATPSKRLRIEEDSTPCVWLRLCDSFIRTDGNLICPIIKAETSIRVFFRLQEKALLNILRKVYRDTKVETKTITLLKSPSDRDLQGNLFIQCVSRNIINEKKLNNFKERLMFYLSKKTTVKDISIEKVNSTKEMIPQPMISEPDFEMHKVELCYKLLSKLPPDSDKNEAESCVMESIKKVLDEFKENHTKIALLSQNGKGKSFLLNLLFLLTTDNEKEYQNNNKNLKLPKDVTGNPTIKELGETINQLPDVVKDFLKTYKKQNEKFKTLMEPICFYLKSDNSHAIKKSTKLFSSLPNYFNEGGRIYPDSYLLAQKTVEHSYESTTKCIIHLRYGTVYQMKVDYFSSKDLKQQLFECVSLCRNDKTNVNNDFGFNKDIKDKSYECLEARFAILTGSDVNENVLQNCKTYKDIVLCDEVNKFAGRTELYIGSGRNSTEDRLALKAILKSLTSPQKSEEKWKYRIAAVKKIVVYLPSKILYGGKEILEMPGTDDSDALALDFINKGLSMVDAVLVMNEFAFKIGEKEVKDMLINSDFMHNWKKCPERSLLMLLSYPEKDVQFQFKNGDTEEIEKLKSLEVKRRATDLESLCKLLGMRSLPQDMDTAVFTSCILPVLYTSIHAQKGKPHQVIDEHACFLKHTGIEKLITHLDAFTSSSRKTDLQELQKMLTAKKIKGLSPKHAKAIVHMYKKRTIKGTLENNLIHNYEGLKVNLFKDLQSVYKDKLDGEIAGTLANVARQSVQMWDTNKGNIPLIGVFNPYYSGNHKIYQVKISRIVLDNIEEHLKSKIFAFLNKDISKLLNKFKVDVIDLFTRDLNSVLEMSGHKKISLRIFVEKSIQDVLSESQQWYFGKVRNPINELTIGRYLQESKHAVLKKHILTPAYKLSDLNLAKQQARKNIADAVMAVKDELKVHLLKLHDKRWASFSSHLKVTNGVPKPWSVLLNKVKQSCKRTSTQQKRQEKLSAVLKLIKDIKQI